MPHARLHGSQPSRRPAQILALLAVALARAGEASAAAPEGSYESIPLSIYMTTIPKRFQAVAAQETAPSSGPASRLRFHSIEGAAPAAPAGTQDAPMLEGTTVWQRMDGYRTHNRVRLINLWESRANSFSLQTNGHGQPSLQWIYRSMSPKGATKGLLDDLVPAAVRHLTRRPQSGAPAANGPASIRGELPFPNYASIR